MVLLATCGRTTGRLVAPPRATATRFPTATPTPVPLPHLSWSFPPLIQARAAYVYDPYSGATIYSLHGDLPLPMASTTKIMTAVVAITQSDLSHMITVPSSIATLFAPDVSVVCCPRILPGEQFTIGELLYGLLLPSGADAAYLIAQAVAGGEAPFVARMNVMARLLGMQHTHYVNVHGLDVPGHETTAHDLALLTTFAMSLPQFRQVVVSARVTLHATGRHPAIALENTNELLTSGGDLAIDGVKTGWTGAAGYCVVLDARRGGHELIAVILGDGSDYLRFADGAALLRWAYALPSPIP